MNVSLIHTTCENCVALKAELDTVRGELSVVKEHLKKYTAPERNREYYNSKKEELKKDPEYKKKRSEINKRAYEKRKESKLALTSQDEVSTLPEK
jgi:hypothetical protein